MAYVLFSLTFSVMEFESILMPLILITTVISDPVGITSKRMRYANFRY